MNDKLLPFTKPSISQEAIDEVVTCLKSGWLTTGPRVQQFTQALKHYLQSPYAVTLNSATAGLHVSLLALNLQPGDEVITTPMTFIASANTIVQAGGKPIFVDIDPNTYNLDIDQVAKAVSPNTRAIMPVHFAGLPVDLDPLYDLAKQYNLRIVEDCAHAIGAEYKGKRLGSFGDTQIFSFHPNKNMTTGEGGCITSKDEELINLAKQLLFHGIKRDHEGAVTSHDYDVPQPGFKYNMLDMQAALGLHQLAELDQFIERRQQLANRYLDILNDSPYWQLPVIPSYKHKHAWHLFTPLLNCNKTGLSRDKFIAKMRDEGIAIGFHYKAVHLFSFYQKTFGYQCGDFPHAEDVSNTIVSLPLFPTMTDDEQDRVFNTINKLFRS